MLKACQVLGANIPNISFWTTVCTIISEEAHMATSDAGEDASDCCAVVDAKDRDRADENRRAKTLPHQAPTREITKGAAPSVTA